MDETKPHEKDIVKSSDLGQAILAEAQRRYDESRREAVLDAVQRYMSFRDDALRKIEHNTKAADWYTRKLAAIHAGEFTMENTTGSMTFTDADLNRANY